MLKDKDIREPLFDFLEEQYGKTRIIEEKTMGKSRADVVMVLEEELVGIEIHRQVIFPAIPKIQADHVPGYIKGNKGADTRNVFQILDIQLRGKLHLPKGTPVRQIQVHLKMFIVKVSKKVHQRFLDASYVKIILKECDSLHSDILTNHSYVVSFYRKSSIL